MVYMLKGDMYSHAFSDAIFLYIPPSLASVFRRGFLTVCPRLPLVLLGEGSSFCGDRVG